MRNSFLKLKNELNKKTFDSFTMLIMISLGINLIINLGFVCAVKNIMKQNDKGVPLTTLYYEAGRSIYLQSR